jgi:acyl-CoA synthetase (AMP-forming)/AMP-acid ligase II
MMNISLLLEMAADAAGDRVGLVCNDQRWTYQQLLDAARGAAQLIREAGCSHVALLDESSEASVIALFGAAMAGVPYCPLNYRLADEDLGKQLERISPALLVGDDARAARLFVGAQDQRYSREAFIALAAETGKDLASTDSDDEGEPIALQLFTSGTTAAPKAAILRHSNLLSYILGTVEFASADEADAALISVPPYHIAGISALLSSIYSLRRMVMLPNFAPAEWLRLVDQEGVTNAFVVPTMLSRVIETLDKDDSYKLGSLRAIAYGGGKMPLEIIQRALTLFPTTNFTNAYGLTETSSTIALLGPEEHREAISSDDPAVKARLVSVGKPLPTVEIEIRDDEGRCLGAGEAGEIYVRGEQVSGEYREKSAIDGDGWFPTRDAGYLDEHGYLYLSGRADDVIVRGGENLSPGEIEDVLLTHPAVSDACAVGMASVEWGEAVAVALVLREGATPPAEDEVKNFIRGRLRSSRVPEAIRIEQQLPYNEMGKLLRREVKKLFAA